jgi:hypothetical protein
MSINNTILSVTRRTVNGFTVGEIFDRIQNRALSTGVQAPLYSSVRAQVYRLAQSGQLVANSFRKDSVSGRDATTFVRSN